MRAVKVHSSCQVCGVEFYEIFSTADGLQAFLLARGLEYFPRSNKELRQRKMPVFWVLNTHFYFKVFIQDCTIKRPFNFKIF